MQQYTDGIESTPNVTRRAVMKAAGLATVGFGAIAAGAGTAAATPECVACVKFGKIEGQPEVGDLYTFTKRYEGTTYTVRIRVDDVEYEDGEAVGFDWTVVNYGDELAVCKIDVKGGPDTRTWESGADCGGTYSADGAFAPDMHRRNRNREYYGISNVTFYFCIPGEECTA